MNTCKKLIFVLLCVSCAYSNAIAITPRAKKIVYRVLGSAFVGASLLSGYKFIKNMYNGDRAYNDALNLVFQSAFRQIPIDHNALQQNLSRSSECDKYVWLSMVSALSSAGLGMYFFGKLNGIAAQEKEQKNVSSVSDDAIISRSIVYNQ